MNPSSHPDVQKLVHDEEYCIDIDNMDAANHINVWMDDIWMILLKKNHNPINICETSELPPDLEFHPETIPGMKLEYVVIGKQHQITDP